ncbi:MAG: hypothetical protein QGH39_11160 [Candidatus Thermoplasmatota archaeon]|nr:hypothetical protein [Candidatus Thermoplasmatota archaeon]MDP7266103.1 hypothetical protein [Candidatus Thermoplasmatota archaeon]
MRLKFSFTALAVLFSIIGIALLQILAMMAKPGAVSLNHIEDHEGETVVVDGVVCEYYFTERGETVIKLAGSGVIVPVVVETGRLDMSTGDRLEATGKIVKINNGFELQVARASLIKKTGTVVGKTIALETINAWKGEYIQTRGVVSDLEEKDFFVKARVFDPLSRYEVDWYIYEIDQRISIGSEVNFTTFIDGSRDEVSLQTYMIESISLEGFWESKELGIRRAFESLSSNRREFMFFPVNITGYVLYQPNPIFPSITLSDRVETGGRTLKVSVTDGSNISGMDRRDLVKVRGRLTENEKTFGLEMTSFFIELIEKAPTENINIDQIQESPYLYRDAKTGLKGFVGGMPDRKNIYGDLNITLTGYFILNESGHQVLRLGVNEQGIGIMGELESIFNTSSEKSIQIEIGGKLRFISETLSYVYEVSEISI